MEDSSTNNSRPKVRKSLFIAISVIAILCVIIAVFLSSAFLSTPSSRDSLLFKGAYAQYQGSTSVMGIDFSFSATQEVLDFNSTHAYISTSFSMGSDLGESANEENSTWVPLSQFGLLSAFSDSNITSSYDATLNFGSLGTRECTIYEVATDGPTMTVYVDKVTGWPLKMKATMTGEDNISLSLDINLVETNIPELK